MINNLIFFFLNGKFKVVAFFCLQRGFYLLGTRRREKVGYRMLFSHFLEFFWSPVGEWRPEFCVSIREY